MQHPGFQQLKNIGMPKSTNICQILKKDDFCFVTGVGKKNPKPHEESNPSPSAPALDVLPLNYKELYSQLGYNNIDV